MILVVTYSRIPDGDASATRDFTFARLFHDCGYEVKVIGMGNTPPNQPFSKSGIAYLSLRLPGISLKKKCQNFLFYRYRLASHLENLEKLENIQAIYLRAIPTNALLYIRKYALKKRIPLVIEICEWRSASQFKLGKLNWNYWRNAYFVRFFPKQGDQIIAISCYLERYLRDKNCRVVRIPAIMDVRSIQCKKVVDPKKTVILYAGSPGKKDSFEEIISGLALLSREAHKLLELRVIGIGIEELATVLSSATNKRLKKLGGVVNCMGRLSQEAVVLNLQEADFSVLMRPVEKRYAKAGFPTKIAESMACATPPICNLSSDLGLYLVDGEDSLIVQETSASGFALAVKRALKLGRVERERMCANARRTAEKCFDFRGYRSDMRNFLRDD